MGTDWDVVIIGAGPTGVEMAGSLAEISRHTLARDFHNIDPSQARILLAALLGMHRDPAAVRTAFEELA